MRVWVLILITSLLAIGSARKPAPPQPVFHGHFRSENQRLKIADKIAHWSKRDKTNPWELGGLYQGDIMEADNLDTRSGMENPGARWPGGIVPYYIQKGFFNGHQIRIIHSAINEFHKRTCIRFRPYKKGDSSFIVIKGQKGGCWSYIGRVSNRRKPGQQVNLQIPGCVHRGVVVHELMHAIGFYHQHSAANRDRYINIIWHNIRPGKLLYHR
ncbi:Metalloendopeptidase [Gryllus bimaculatus]|nr:Metalloendopeptidase [Gryllus bimaculatus]